MNRDELKEFRDTYLAFNEDGDFVFTKRTKDGKHRTYGPYNFGDAMRICWLVMKEFKNEKD